MKLCGYNKTLNIAEQRPNVKRIPITHTGKKAISDVLSKRIRFFKTRKGPELDWALGSL